VEIPFEGTGWTYLGERDGREGTAYESRRFEGKGVVFSLLASKPGDYLLRFQRQDALRGLVYDEFVSLKVTPKAALPAPAQQAAPAAPGNAAASPALPAGQLAAPAAGQGAAPALGPGAAPAPGQGAAVPAKPAPDSPEAILIEAKNELGAGRVSGALEALDRLLARYPSGIDEAFYLYALALEQNGPLKDIRRALALYRKVCSDYPQSAFWDKSAERAAYIERHYFEIR